MDERHAYMPIPSLHLLGSHITQSLSSLSIALVVCFKRFKGYISIMEMVLTTPMWTCAGFGGWTLHVSCKKHINVGFSFSLSLSRYNEEQAIVFCHYIKGTQSK